MTLHELRKARGLTLAGFGELIGATAGQVHEWEGGKHFTVERAARIEAALGITGLVASVAEDRASKARAAA